MSFASRLIGGAAALLSMTIIVCASELVADSSPESQATSYPQPVSSPRSSDDYLGSKACARCHQVEQQQWTNSLHIKMTKPVAEAVIVGDFSPTARLNDHGRAY